MSNACITGHCPNCQSTALLVYTRLAVNVDADTWDVDTPFMFDYDDETECRDCDWEGTYGDCVPELTGAL